MKVVIDSELCQGHGRCYELAPELFTDDDRGRGWVSTPEVPAELADKARAAVNACPEGAISLQE